MINVIGPTERNQQKTQINKTLSQRKTDSNSYERFIEEYLSKYGKQSRSNDDKLILSINNQHIYLPTSSNLYSDIIDKDLLPFETESYELVVILNGQSVVIPTDHWLYYKNKYQTSPWVYNIKRVHRNLPQRLLPFIEQWLSDHTTVLFDIHKINVDGVIIPIKGRLDYYLSTHPQPDVSYWHEVFNYLTQTGFVSYNSKEKIVYLANSELDCQRVLKVHSPERIDRVAKYLRTLNNVHIENGSLFVTENFIIPNDVVHHVLIKYEQKDSINANELACLLLDICRVEENTEDQKLILTLNDQKLEVINYENHMDILIQWLNKINQEKSIDITDDNDIIIYITDEKHGEQRIFIKHENVDAYMKTKANKGQNDVITIDDIVTILFTYNYVQYSAGQLIFPMQNIVIDTNELRWLHSIINAIHINDNKRETEVELIDGNNEEIIRIPYEILRPTHNKMIISNYLFLNGTIKYDPNSGNYIYRYIPSGEESPQITEEYKVQHELLSSQIRNIHVDQKNRTVEVEFIYEPSHYLPLPSNWYKTILENQFNRSYIIDMLLKYGGTFDQDSFIFNGHSYSLQPLDDSSIKQKQNFIDYYVEYVNSKGEINYDNDNHILILENPTDSSKLYLTVEHSDFIKRNNYRREDMKAILVRHGEIKQDEFQNWLLYYNDQCVQLPLIDETNDNDQNELLNQCHQLIDYMYNHNLITCNKRLKSIQLSFSNQTLTIPFNRLERILNLKSNSPLPFTSHQLSQWLINNSEQITYSNPKDSIQIIYKTKVYLIPLKYLKDQSKENTRLELLFPFNKSLRLIQKTPSTTTLDIEKPSKENNYAIDPLLILANYIHRAGRIYQDDVGRLVIKLDRNEIVVPQNEAANAIEAINAAPQRTGTIITRLINRIGKIQSTQAGGLLITIGKNSFELPKEAIDRSYKSAKSPVLPLIRHSKSASTLSSSSIDEQRSFKDDQQIIHLKDGRGDARYLNSSHMSSSEQSLLDRKSNSEVKIALIIIPYEDKASASKARFYIQYTNNRIPTSRSSSNSRLFSSNEDLDQSKRSELISPQTYQNVALRNAPVYVHKSNEKKFYYHNLAHYLSVDQSYLSSRTVRRMLKFTSSDEYFAYLNTSMSKIHAQKLVKESEDTYSKYGNNYPVEPNYRQRPRSKENRYHVQNLTSNINEDFEQPQPYRRQNFSSKPSNQKPIINT